MNLTDASTTQITIVITMAVIAVIGMLAWFFNRKRRTERLHTQFGSAEYARAVKEGGGQREPFRIFRRHCAASGSRGHVFVHADACLTYRARHSRVIQIISI